MYEESDKIVRKIELPRPFPGQVEIIKSKARYRILCCGRRWGKSVVCLHLAIDTILKGGKVAYITPQYKLGKEFFQLLLKQFPKEVIEIQNQTDLTLQLAAGYGSVKFYSGEAEINMRGLEFDRVIVEEAAHIPNLRDKWLAVIQPTLLSTRGDALFASSPNGTNFFYDLFIKGKEKTDRYESWHFPTSTSPRISQEDLEAIRLETIEMFGEDVYLQEYEAIPTASTGNPFGYTNIQKNIIKELSTKETIVYGIDLAKYRDYCVFFGIDEDGNQTFFDRFKGQEYSYIEQKIIDLPEHILKVIDATGNDAFHERIKTVARNVTGFKFTGVSKPKLIEELIRDVQMGNIKYNQEVADEMMVFEMSLSAAENKIYEAQSGKHDDCVMAMAIANKFKNEATRMNNWKLYTM